MNKLEISEIEIIPVKPREGLVAFTSFVLNNSLSLNSIAVYLRPNGSSYRLVYPNKILPNGKEINIFYPIHKEASEVINEAIFNKYEELLRKT